MSNLTRMTIAQWFCLAIGVALMTLQVVKYFKGSMELSVSEAVVTFMAAALMFAPKALSDAFKKILSEKSKNKCDHEAE